MTTYGYDPLGRTTKVTQPDPDGAGPQVAPWTVYAYDAVGDLLSATDRLGHATTYTYDNLGRLTSETDPDGGETDYTYDADGNTLTLTDPENNTTTWTYDGLDRVVQETNQLAASRYYQYGEVKGTGAYIGKIGDAG